MVESHDIFRAMSQQFHSLRMHASRGDKHISGSERLLPLTDLDDAVTTMLGRALNHPRGKAEKISITLQPVPFNQVRKAQLLPLSTCHVENWCQGRELAAKLLMELGLDQKMVRQSINLLAAGPSSLGGVMRGAVLIDAATGKRLEHDQVRGVRVSRMDLNPGARPSVSQYLSSLGLDNSRVIEAWALASKVAHYPHIVAELCWSDDPDYLTGYISSSKKGYQRITQLKEAGSEIGGRIFFVKTDVDVISLIDKLQHEPVLFDLSPNLKV